MKTYISTLIILLFLPQESKAQNSTDARAWFSAGLGAWTRQGEGLIPFSGMVNFSYQTGAQLFSVQGVAAIEFCIEYCDHENDYWSWALMYGRSTRKKWVQASLAMGPALVGRYEHEGIQNDPLSPIVKPYRTLGLAMETQWFLHTATIGIGLDIFANLNQRTSFLGMTLNLQTGKLR